MPFFVPNYVRVDVRIPPPKLTLATGHQRRSVTPHRLPLPLRPNSCHMLALPSAGRRTHCRISDLMDVRYFPCQPVRKFPEDDPIQFPVHDRGIVRKLVEVGPSRQFAVQALHHVNLVHAIIA